MQQLQQRLGSIALIGGGKMGEAIVSGLIKGTGFDADGICVAEPFEERWPVLNGLYGVRCVADGSEIADADTFILAVKPQIMDEVASSLAAAAGFAPQRVISIAAGVTTTALTRFFTDTAVIRVMPNINLSVSAGMSVVAPAEGTSMAEAELVCELFSQMGKAVVIDEGLIDAATAVNGSGPAYFALFAEELAAAGAEAGIPEDIAKILATQTLIGTGRYLQMTEESPAELRAAVTSPGGTTQAALESFAEQGFGAVVREAFAACLKRARELG